MAGTGSSVAEIRLERFLSRSLLCSSSPASLVVRLRDRVGERRWKAGELRAGSLEASSHGAAMLKRRSPHVHSCTLMKVKSSDSDGGQW
jgi:hypothetical protein